LFVQRTKNVTDSTNTSSNNERKILVLPYVKSLSEFISSNIDSSKTTIGFRCLNKLSRFVKVHKDIDHASFKNNVIYKTGCKNCDVTYVGQTNRQLKTRIKEHKNNLK